MDIVIETVSSGIHLREKPTKDLERVIAFIKQIEPSVFKVDIDNTDEAMGCVYVNINEISGNTRLSFQFLNNLCSSAVFIFGENLSGFTYAVNEQYSFKCCLADVKVIVEYYTEIKKQYQIKLNDLRSMVHQAVERFND